MSKRLEISDNGRVIYAQDVESYSLEFDSAQLTLTATHNIPRDPSAPVVTVDGGPPLDLTTVITSTPPGPGIQLGDLDSLIPPPQSAGAPDGDDEPTVHVIERVHTGDRDPTAEATTRRRRKSDQLDDQ